MAMNFELLLRVSSGPAACCGGADQMFAVAPTSCFGSVRV
jgi:hypothetical protein